MWLSLPLNRIGLTLMLSSFVLLSPEGAQAVPCDPINETVTSVIQQDGTPPADDPVSYPYPVTALQLLQAIDGSSGYLVILPSGKPLAEQKLEEQDAGTLHLFDRNRWKEPTVSIQLLQALGWQIDVVNPPGARVGTTSVSSRVRGSTRLLKVVFAYPPRENSEDPFQTLVIPLKYADLYEVVEALRAMPPSRKRVSHFTVIPSQTTNSVVLITTEPFVIKRCEQLIDQIENVAKKQHACAPEEALNLEELEEMPAASTSGEMVEGSPACEESEEAAESASSVISQIITEMQNSSIQPEILSTSTDKRADGNLTRHTYSAIFANKSIGDHLIFIEKIRTQAPHLNFEMLEIKNKRKKNSTDTGSCELRFKLTNYSGIKSETESE